MIAHDTNHALRSFRREPGFAAGVVFNFALAIGATAAMFGLVNRLLLAPPPGIAAADRLVRFGLVVSGTGAETYTLTTTSYPVYLALAADTISFDKVAAASADTVTVGRGADLEQVAVVKGSGDYFATLGVRPALGRLFGREDDLLPAGNDVVVLGYAFWQRKFGGAPAAVGAPLIVDGQSLTVIGVAPRDFNGTELGTSDVYVPLSTAMRTRPPGWWSNSGLNVVSIVARLRSGVRPTFASQHVTTAVRDASATAGRERLRRVSLEPLAGAQSMQLTAQARIAVWAAGVALAVLLICTANAGTMLLLRAARRRGETAVRLALGARLRHLARQSVVEGVLLSATGAAFGLLVSRWLSDLMRLTLLPGLAPRETVADTGVLVASTVAAVGAGILAGLTPLMQFRRSNVVLDLRAGGGHGSSAHLTVQRLLVTFQVALCTVLLIGAGLFMKSMVRVQAQDLGFSTARLLYVTLDFRGALHGAAQDLAYEAAARRVRALPGVTGASVAQGMPFASHNVPPISIPGYQLPPPDVEQLPILYAATPIYLEMMGVRARAGRLFTDQDVRNAPLVALVNETMARRVWPGQSAIGKCIRAGLAADPDIEDPMVAVASLPCREVVGVVRDSRARSLRTEGGEATLMQYYVPFGQVPQQPFADAHDINALLVRGNGEPQALAGAVQRTIQGTSAVSVYASVHPYQELLDPQLRSWRLGATLFTVFGALALGIAAMGLFAVVSYLVSQRTQEIGVRMALGGSARAIGVLVLRDAVRLSALGVAVGVAIVMVGAPALQSMLFETSARDATIVLLSALVLLVVTVAAAALPARRAGNVSLISVLKG